MPEPGEGTVGEELEAAVEPLAKLIETLPDGLERQALTHPSWVVDRTTSYERLAFLGDSVLGLAVASEVFARFFDHDSGRLTKILNQSVSGISCAEVGRALGVPERLREAAPADTGAGIPVEVLIGAERPLPEITEALIGACFLAHGFESTASAVAAAFEPQIEFAARTRVDFKSALQELLARRGARITYEVISEAGPPHDRTFEVGAMLEGEQVGRGEGRSKKIAEQVAAEQALRRLGG
ncbi:MAG: ribonuclease III family protein [Solirubrobacterales bacterium]